MVYFLGGGDPVGGLTLLAQGVDSDITVADALPRPAVPFLGNGITSILFIPPCFLFGVFFTEPSVSQFGTTGGGARTFGFIGHTRTSYSNR